MLRRLLKWAVRLLVVLVVLGAGGYGVYRWLVPQASAGSLREEVHTAELLAMEDVLLVAGQVKPAVTIELRAEASGLVDFVAAKEGDRVAAGQELVRLDSKLAQSSPCQLQRSVQVCQGNVDADPLDATLFTHLRAATRNRSYSV